MSWSSHAIGMRRTAATRGILAWFFRDNVGARDRLVKITGVQSSGGPVRWARCLKSDRKLAPRPELRRISQSSHASNRAASPRRGGFSRGFSVTTSAHVTGWSRQRVSHRRVVWTESSGAEDLVGRPTSGRKVGKLSPESPRLGGRRCE
jgi:hypothetical protein